MPSADNLCKLFGPRFVSKVFDNLMAFMKVFFYFYFFAKSADGQITKHAINVMEQQLYGNMCLVGIVIEKK